jgi:hypothetical protein
LIEKKFQDLGEFVEGKEKLKMVVHKNYTSTKELFSMFETDVAAYEDDDEAQNDEIMDGGWFSDEEWEHDILSLGEEETKMLKEAEGEDDDAAGSGEGEEDQKPAAIEIVSPPKKEDGLGKSEDAAITLSSEDESDGESGAPAPATAKAPPVAAGPPAGNSSGTASVQAAATQRLGKVDEPLSNCRLYRMTFLGPSVGMDFADFHGRLVVTSVGRGRSRRLGPGSKPAVGDVLVAIRSMTCQLGLPFARFRHILGQAFQTPPVELVFAEVPEIQMWVRATYQKKSPPVAPPSEIIEIDSDDD